MFGVRCCCQSGRVIEADDYDHEHEHPPSRGATARQVSTIPVTPGAYGARTRSKFVMPRKSHSSLLQNCAKSRNLAVMKCHESRPRRKPIVVKTGNVEVKIYQGKSRGYDLFT